MQQSLHNFALLCTRPCIVAHVASGDAFSLLACHQSQFNLNAVVLQGTFGHTAASVLHGLCLFASIRIQSAKRMKWTSVNPDIPV